MNNEKGAENVPLVAIISQFLPQAEFPSTEETRFDLGRRRVRFDTMANLPKVWATIVIDCSVAKVIAVAQCICGTNCKLELNLCCCFGQLYRLVVIIFTYLGLAPSICPRVLCSKCSLYSKDLEEGLVQSIPKRPQPRPTRSVLY